MRQIKFRAWDKKDKRMIDSDLLMGRCDLNNAFNGREIYKNWIIMQYTELKDKNGKEIYEGDIVKMILRKDNITPIGEIKFGLMQSFFIAYNGDSGDYCFINQEDGGSASDTYKDLQDYNEIDCSDIEIMGNIYENPNLLK